MMCTANWVTSLVGGGTDTIGKHTLYTTLSTQDVWTDPVRAAPLLATWSDRLDGHQCINDVHLGNYIDVNIYGRNIREHTCKLMAKTNSVLYDFYSCDSDTL